MSIRTYLLMRLVFLMVMCLAQATGYAQTYPVGIIENDALEVHLLLPDKKEGYYRGSRFDWAGVISQATYQGHTYFGQWFQRYDPFLHDAIMGPVEAFDPIRYEEANPGEGFLKIGVGWIEKIDDEPYRFTSPFRITDHGKWRVKKGKSSIRFRHTLREKYGYAYRYTKSVELVDETPKMQLVHRLENTGKLPIKTRVYNHNFFMFDEEPIGPSYEVAFAFEPTLISNTNGMGIIADLSENKIVFRREIQNRESIYFVLGGYASDASDYDITVMNKKSGYGVRITNDLPITFLPVWSIRTTLCPEPYIDIEIQPGQSQSWTTTYSFFSKVP
jgi:hypothetical protein